MEMGLKRGVRLRAELERIDHQSQGRLGRIDVLLLRDVLFQYVVLQRPREPFPIRALLFGHCQIHGPKHGRGRIDGHGRGDFRQRNAVEKRLHVRERTDGHAAFAHLSERQLMIGVVAHQRRQIEGHGEPGLPLRQQVAETRIGILGRAEARKLAHRP